jgi:hypothetical protein
MPRPAVFLAQSTVGPAYAEQGKGGTGRATVSDHVEGRVHNYCQGAAVVSSVVQLQTSQSTPASARRIHVDASPALRRLDTFHPGALYIALVARSNGVLYRFPTENNRIAVIVQDTPKQCPHRPAPSLLWNCWFQLLYGIYV